MYCEGKLKLRSHVISYCLIEVTTQSGLIVRSKVKYLKKKRLHIFLNQNDTTNMLD